MPDPPDLLDRYHTLAGASVLPPQYQSFAVAPRGPIDEDGGEASEELTEVHVPTIPSPEQILVYQSFDTITESAVSEHESLSDRFKSAPFDVSWLTISAKFDIDEVLSRFERGDLSPVTEIIRIRREGGDEAPTEPPAGAAPC